MSERISISNLCRDSTPTLTEAPQHTRCTTPPLPLEIWHEVLRYVYSSADLKAIRLVSKAHSTCAGSRLFKTLRLHPRIESLRCVTAVADSPELAAAVTRLELINDSVDEQLNGQKLFEQRLWDGGQLQDVRSIVPTSILSNAFHDYKSRLASQQAFRAWAEISRFSAFLDRLPNVRHLARRCDDPATDETSDAFHRRRLWELGMNLPIGRVDYFPLAEVLALRKRRLRSLELIGRYHLHLDFMQSPQNQMALQDTLRNLRSLTIDQPIYYDNPNNIKLFFQATQTVEEMVLRFVVFPLPSGSEEYHPIVAVFLDQTWSKLRRLVVRDLQCTEEQLVSFLDRHSSTLDHLTFHHLPLIYLAPLASPSSLIRTIWKLGQLPRLHLRQCLFEDNVGNWRPLARSDSDPGLSEQFQEYVCKRGSFPYANHRQALFSRFADRADQTSPSVRAEERELARRYATHVGICTSSTVPWSLDEIDFLARIMNRYMPFDEVQR